jgi:hypothetical protein
MTWRPMTTYLDRVAVKKELKELEEENNRLKLQLSTANAKIDALMLEYCPHEMTSTQLENWAIHQTRSKGHI